MLSPAVSAGGIRPYSPWFQESRGLPLQGSQRRHSSLPSFGADVPAAEEAAPQAPVLSSFQPAAAAALTANGQRRPSAVAEDEVDLEPPSARCLSRRCRDSPRLREVVQASAVRCGADTGTRKLACRFSALASVPNRTLRSSNRQSVKNWSTFTFMSKQVRPR